MRFPLSVNTEPWPPAAGAKFVRATVAALFAAMAAAVADCCTPEMAASLAVLVKVAAISAFVMSRPPCVMLNAFFPVSAFCSASGPPP